MNCYIKLHDNNKLQAFVYEKVLGSSYSETTAITALAESGYIKEALYLAKENRLFDLYLSIQIEKANAFKEAMDYIWTLSGKEAEKALIRYGKVLIDSLAHPVTELLINLSTDFRGDHHASNPELFIHCFIDTNQELRFFLEAVTKQRDHCDPTVWNTLLELILRDMNASAENDNAKLVMELLTNPKACYDIEEALILLQTYECNEGLVYIYKKLQMHSLLLHLYVELRRYEDAIQLCKSRGVCEPSLWMELLTSFAKLEPVEKEEWELVINAVELSGCFSLYEIIHTVAENSCIPSSYCRDLARKQLERERSITNTVLLTTRLCL